MHVACYFFLFFLLFFQALIQFGSVLFQQLRNNIFPNTQRHKRIRLEAERQMENTGSAVTSSSVATATTTSTTTTSTAKPCFLSDGTEATVGLRVFAVGSSSQGNYSIGDSGVIVKVHNGNSPFVQWDNDMHGQPLIASRRKLQTAFIHQLADDVPVRPGLRVAVVSNGGAQQRRTVGRILRVARRPEVAVEWNTSTSKKRKRRKEVIPCDQLCCVDEDAYRFATYNIGRHCQTLLERGTESCTVTRLLKVRPGPLKCTVLSLVSLMYVAITLSCLGQRSRLGQKCC